MACRGSPIPAIHHCSLTANLFYRYIFVSVYGNYEYRMLVGEVAVVTATLLCVAALCFRSGFVVFCMGKEESN